MLLKALEQRSLSRERRPWRQRVWEGLRESGAGPHQLLLFRGDPVKDNSTHGHIEAS